VPQCHVIVVLDTSIIGADFGLDSISFRLLFDNHHLTGHRVAVPEIVIQETVNRFREKLSAEMGKLAAAARELGKMTLEKVAVAKVDQPRNVQYYEQNLRRKLQYRGNTILPLPRVRQQALIDRALKRRKPFSESGNGYRDALIWETILNYGRKHRRDRVAFLTANTKDFCEGTDLHQHLVDDLVAANLRKDYVKVFTTLQDFTGKEVMPKLPRPHGDFVKYTTANWPKFRLADSLLRLFEDKLQHKEVDSDTLGQPYYIEDPTIQGIHEPDTIEVLNERRTKQKERILELQAEVECLFDCYIEKHEYWCMEGDDQISATDWNETYMAGEFYQTIRVTAYATFDERKGDLVDLEITDIESTKTI
jgi:hypothetical protein